MTTDHILKIFGLDPENYKVEIFGSGLINHTWKVSGDADSYILQNINSKVFKHPQDIADNLVALQNYLQETAPGYVFPAPLKTTDSKYLVIEGDQYYRLLPFVKNSHTIDVVTDSHEAYHAAKQFGKFSRLLKDFDTTKLKYTLPDFHNLSLRVGQFNTALRHATANRIDSAGAEIAAIQKHADIAEIYQNLLLNKNIPLRVMHHDTKISNVLFDTGNQGLCVIDLDTVMPGYYISDVGDMMRTYLSPANEEEQDLDKIEVREEYFAAIYKGYMEEMGEVLSTAEKDLFIYAGKFMIYMQALRFLTDHLNGDIYYHTSYPGHNLKRAQNQLTLLDRYVASQDKFQQLLAS